MAALSSVCPVKKADDPLVSSCVDGVRGRGQEMTWGSDLPFSNIQAETIPGMHWSVQVASVGFSSVLPVHAAYFKVKTVFLNELIFWWPVKERCTPGLRSIWSKACPQGL